jgi:hypothetical protein
MNVLIGCEKSQVICKAFRSMGHNAFSCDIDPCTGGFPQWHLHADLLKVISSHNWDLMIAHPPCTYLSNAGLHYCNIEVHGRSAIERIKKRNKAIDFFLELWDAPIKKICLENPVGHINTAIIKPTQIIHPYYFGEREMKKTCLWLKNLQPLNYRMESDLFGEMTATKKPEPYQVQVRKATGQKKNRYWTDGIFNNKLKTGEEKSVSFESIAKAMADQWGNC